MRAFHGRCIVISRHCSGVYLNQINHVRWSLDLISSTWLFLLLLYVLERLFKYYNWTSLVNGYMYGSQTRVTMFLKYLHCMSPGSHEGSQWCPSVLVGALDGQALGHACSWLNHGKFSVLLKKCQHLWYYRSCISNQYSGSLFYLQA